MAEGELGAAFKALARSAADAAERVTAKAAQLTERTAEIEETNLDALARTDQKAADAITAEVNGTAPDGLRVLPLAGAAVMQICVDYALTLLCNRDGAAYEIRIEEAFEFTTADGSGVTLSPEIDPTGLGPVLACTRTTVVAANAFEDGRLQMVFADGSALAVPTAEKYESWNLVGPGGFRIVSGPGPKLTVWPGDDPIAP